MGVIWQLPPLFRNVQLCYLFTLQSVSVLATLAFLDWFILLSYAYECFAFVYACTPRSCLEPEKVRRGHWIP